MNIKRYSYDGLPDKVKENDFMLSENGCGKESASYLVLDLGGEEFYVESDAMEKEDAIFGRDLDWIMDWVKAAYEAGLKEGESR